MGGLLGPCALAFKKVEVRASLTLSVIIIITAVIWTTSALVWPSGLPLLVVSYTLGLRHALDADHIAAIDNVTRKLLQAGQKPTTVGLMFSLGHSSVVIIAAMLVAICSASISSRYEHYHAISGFIGASISATFLTVIAIANAVGVYCIVKQLKALKDRSPTAAAGADMQEKELGWEEIMNSGGPITRLVGKRLFNAVDRPYKMYVVGFLFGLGFDTATEITILAIASLQGSQGTQPGYILFLPLLFTSGMALVDYLDGLLMLGVYGWALVSPLQKLFYNLVITTVSCLCALFIALIEYLGIIAEATSANGPFWDGVGIIGDEFQYMGIGLVVAFLLGWAVAAGIFYGSGYHLVDPKRSQLPVVPKDPGITAPAHFTPDQGTEAA